MRKKVLLVDDSSTELMLESVILSKQTSYELVTALDGQEAIRKAASESPDLILMDVLMPKMDGFEACRAIRKDRRTAHIPIVLVTSEGQEGCMEIGFASGCNDYITKPMSARELVLVVEKYLAQEAVSGTEN